MSKIIDRAGKGAAISAAENDANLDSLHGINVAVAGTTYTVTVADQGNTLEFTSASAVAVTLTSIATIIGNADTSDFKVTLIATGAGTVTVTPDGLNTINNGASTIVLTTDEYTTIQTDSTALIWNIINGLGDATTLDGFDSSELVQIANAQTITGVKTFSADVTVDKDAPTINLDTTASDSLIEFKKGGTRRALIVDSQSSDSLVLAMYDLAGATITARIDITRLGKVNVTTGDLQIAGTDLYAIVPRLAVANTFTGAMTIEKASPTLALNATTGEPSIVLQSAGVSRGTVFWESGGDQLAIRMFDIGGSVVSAQIFLTELGKVNIATGDLQIAGVDATSIFASLVSNTFTGNQSIFKASPVYGLDASSGNPGYYLKDNNVLRSVLQWDRAADSLGIQQYDTDGSTIRAQILLTELGKVNIATGTFQLAGVDVTANASELSILDGVTSTTAELNILDGSATVQATVTLVGTDGVVISDADVMKQALVSDFATFVSANLANPVFTGTLTVGAAQLSEAELEILDGATVTTAELNILDGVTSTAAELNYADGPNSASKFLLLDGSAQTPFANKAAFRGALVHLSADESLSNNTWTHISWDSETSGYDTDSIHDTVTNNQRLTVPAGVTRIRLNAQVIIQNDGAGTGSRQAVFSKNDETTTPAQLIGGGGRYLSAATTGITSFNFSSAVITVIAGDYFTVAAFQNSGGALNIESQITDVSGGSWVSMEIIE